MRAGRAVQIMDEESKRHENGTRSLTIGFIAGNISSEHTLKLMHGVEMRAKECGIQVYAFLGVHTRDYYQVAYGHSSGIENYDYQCNVVFNYVNLGKFDALIISNSTVGVFLDGRTMEEFLTELGDTPKVITEELGGKYGCSTVICDNYGGEYEAVTHLIEKHGCRDIVVIGGPEGNTDAQERIRAVRDAMACHGLVLDETRLEYGDFSSAAEEQLERLFDSHPCLDAIVAGNDLMARTAYRVCEEHGKRVGTDVKIVGFDDTLEIVPTLSPPLTSVFQNSIRIGRTAVDLAIELCEGKKPRQVVDRVKLDLRSSCGCRFSPGENYYRETLRDMAQQFRQFQLGTWLMPIVGRMMLSSLHNEEDFYRTAMNKLEELQCKNAWMLLLEEPVSHGYGEPWECPDSLNVVFAMTQEGKRVYRRQNAPKLTRQSGLDKLAYDALNGTQVFRSVIPIFFEQLQLGILIADAPITQMPMIYLAMQQIETAMQFFTLNRALEERNAILEMTSEQDPMTGTLNRRGLMERVVNEMGKNAGTVMRVYLTDLDHLKIINDTYGHTAGDEALLTLVSVLQDIFREDKQWIARIGGDEFLIFDADAGTHKPDEMIGRITDKLRNFNEHSKLPYYVEVSVGYGEFEASRDIPLHQIMRCADDALYEAKRGRRRTPARAAEEGLRKDTCQGG